ncbi:MAG: DNA polymerase III subunit chi [Gammaproteobacteria bacterium]
MTRVDFYVVADESDTARLNVACRLAEKAHVHGHRVHVHTESAAQAKSLDGYLWTYRDGGFVPHALIDDELITRYPGAAPILIGHGQEPVADTEILINLANSVPDFFSRLDRVMEVVGGDAPTRATARERFKFYRDRGYDLKSHNL